MDYTERINGFQVRDVSYLGKRPENAPIQYDIVKWEQYDEPQEVMSVDLEKGNICRRVSYEYCYSVGRLVWNPREPCFEFESVGLRWLESNPDKAVVDMILKFAEEKEKEINGAI